MFVRVHGKGTPPKIGRELGPWTQSFSSSSSSSSSKPRGQIEDEDENEEEDEGPVQGKRILRNENSRVDTLKPSENIERPTSYAERRSERGFAMSFDVRCWMFLR